MKVKYKPVLMSMFVVVFTILIVVSISNAGILRHTIMSPFHTLVAEDETDYPSGLQASSTEYSIANIYKDFDEYVDDNIREPFCRIGGQYRVLVHNDPTPGHPVQDWDMKVYYCKTTLDLLERVRIPLDWSGDDLLVYCNDGANINSNTTNFDYITTLMNTYKACIIRNLNKDDHNTLVFGYDVGNKIVDNYDEFFFDAGTKSGPVLTGMVYMSNTFNETGSATSYAGRYPVPYKSETVTTTIGYGTEEETITETKWVPRTADEVREYLVSEHDLQADIEIYHQSNEVVTGETCTSGEFMVCTTDITGDSYSVYTVRVPYTYAIAEYVFNYTKTNRPYYFGYDFNDGFYYMKDFDERLELEILDVFTDASIGLSRVALFKKIDDKFIYGYEEVSNSVSSILPYNMSLKPVYKIRLDNFDFGQQRCVDSLMKYDSMHNVFEANTGVSCNGNEISIVSLNVDTNENDYKYSFHIFKNIATNLR